MFKIQSYKIYFTNMKKDWLFKMKNKFVGTEFPIKYLSCTNMKQFIYKSACYSTLMILKINYYKCGHILNKS